MEPGRRVRCNNVRAQIKLCLKARDDASATRSLPLTTIAKPMNRFAACGDPRAERGQGSKDDQGRNDRLVQIGPEGLAASAHVMGRPQDRAPYWGYRRWCLSDAVECPD